ncbi:unnamed protein product [Trifolium pratense]|uniref:Uncharacterized protein n=1 Tax=Trifolium pratense TaxID=57577 RepID=A0ACB0JB70_TRIPR|nr:unnamed protein product [Trifolium pratense]
MASSSFLPTKEVEGESVTVPNWLELPKDITTNILQRLETFEIVTSACLVCPLWWNICKDPLMWRTIRMRKRNIYHSDNNLVDICRFAIERSCGQLESICVEYFGTDELLQCIAENASKLRCLRFVNCWRITDKGFSEAVRKFPLLEGLDISLCNLSKDSLEVVGRCCTLLKWLKFVREGFYDFNGDDKAFVIAETMSGLRQLNIIGNDITDVGLISILDGCPLLETLDIRRCYNLDLSGSLRKRCLQQIKDVHLPIMYHSEEYEYDDDHVTYHDSLLDDDSYDPYD